VSAFATGQVLQPASALDTAVPTHDVRSVNLSGNPRAGIRVGALIARRRYCRRGEGHHGHSRDLLRLFSLNHGGLPP
jgi:hypothetical protein